MSRRIVETDAEGNHLLERPGWRMRIEHAGLHRPWSPLGMLDTLPQRQRGVLMPGHQPVRARRFVEQGRSKGHWRRPDELAGDLEHPGISRIVPSTTGTLEMCRAPALVRSGLAAESSSSTCAISLRAKTCSTMGQPWSTLSGVDSTSSTCWSGTPLLPTSSGLTSSVRGEAASHELVLEREDLTKLHLTGFSACPESCVAAPTTHPSMRDDVALRSAFECRV